MDLLDRDRLFLLYLWVWIWFLHINTTSRPFTLLSSFLLEHSLLMLSSWKIERTGSGSMNYRHLH